jgi:RNA polymerase sigma factor (sigma-70 family)
MSSPNGPLLSHLRALAWRAAGYPDAVLLDRFLRGRDEDAFATLMARHGPMVLGVCRRVLRDPHAAEDAFQAAFLVLARRASSIRPAASLAAWLHGVSRRVAWKALRAEERRRRRERRSRPTAPPADPLDELTARELFLLLDQEVARLPEAYRLPVILCCLEGRTQEEAAALLGWTPGSVRGRLERGRRLLRGALARRGLSLPAVLVAAELSGGAAEGGVSPATCAAISRVARRFAAGQRPTEAALGPATSLAEDILKGMAWTKAAASAGLLAVLVLIAGAGVLAHQALPGGPPPSPPGPTPEKRRELARPDRHGDALPPQAIARLGTLRFRGVRGSLAFSPDGRFLATATGAAGERVTLWDPKTGKPIRQFGGRETLDRLVFSPDGKLLACDTGSARCRVFEVAGGKERFAAAGSHATFIADDKLVTADRYRSPAKVSLWDTRTGNKIHSWEVGSGIRSLAVAAAGHLLALVEEASPDRVQFRDLTTGAKKRAIRVAPGSGLSLAFAPDGKTLATASSSDVRLWEVATGKEVRRWEQRSDSAPVFSPDSQRLAWTGYDGIARVWIAGRKDLKPRALGRPVNNFTAPCFSPDGKVLAAVTDAGVVRLLEAATGREVRPLDAHESPVNRLAVSRDGSRVVSRSRTQILAWEARTGKLLHRLPLKPEGEEEKALLPGGRILFADRTDDPRKGFFLVRDPLTGREQFRIEGRPDVGGSVVAPGGRYAALVLRDGRLGVFDLASGECRYRFFDPREAAFDPQLSADGDVYVWHSRPDKKLEVHVRRQATGKTLVLGGLAKTDALDRWLARQPYLAPNGEWVVLPGATGGLRRWELTTGKELAPLRGAPRTIWQLSWSHDGRFLIAGGTEVPANVIDREARRSMRVWDVTTGKRLPHLERPHIPDCVLFSADGRTMVTAERGRAIHLWETATGKQRGTLHGHVSGGVGALALSADGRILVSGGYDSQVLVWDLTGRMPDGIWRPARLTQEELRAAWGKLAGADARAAHRALWQLVSDPGGAVDLLAKELRPIPRPDPAHVARLIADLDDERFSVRERAGKELKALGELAAPALRKALDRKPSLELRRRAEGLLDGLEHPSGDRLRGMRAVEVLEHIASPEARALLTALAKGAPGARLTREAKATRGRNRAVSVSASE